MFDVDTLSQALMELDENRVLDMLKEFVNSDPSPDQTQAVVSACQKGMTMVGDLFENNEYFLPDLIFAGEIMASGLDILQPVLKKQNTAKAGSIVLATVAGDLHDIGKNIFKGMAEAAGFAVYDLGIDVPAEVFVNKTREVNPDIVGMSGVLTMSLDSMKDTVDALKQAGLRDNVKVIIGGNPVTAEACKHIGADAFTTSAAEGTKICLNWVQNN